MSSKDNWKIHCQAELIHAERARERGNEGMARVCARRAAGHLLQAYYRQRGESIRAPDALHLLRQLRDDAQVPEGVREVAGYFILKVTPERELPVDTDLIQAVRWLALKLLGEDLP